MVANDSLERATRPCQPLVAGGVAQRALVALVLLGACEPSAFDALQSGAKMDAGAVTYPDMEPGGPQTRPRADARSDGAPGEVLMRSDASQSPGAPIGSTADPGAGNASSTLAIDGGGERRDAEPADAPGEDPAAGDSQDPAEPPVGESACYGPLASRLACTGFESDQDASWWRILTSGEVIYSAERAYVGDGALHASSEGAGGTAFVGHAAFPLATSGSLYLRSYLYVPNGVTLDAVIVHGLSEEREPYGGVSILLSDRGLKVDVHPQGPGVSPIFIESESMQSLPRDRWNCLQLQLDISEESGGVRLSLNGALIAANDAPLATLPASGYRGVSAGLVYTGPSQGPVELFVDELVADVMPIPCD